VRWGDWAANSISHNAYAFADFRDLVARNIFQAPHETAGPANLEGIGLGRFAQPKMQARVALLDLSAAAAHFLRLLMVADSDANFGADGVAIGLYFFQFQ
jgi:hypothetical protein